MGRDANRKRGSPALAPEAAPSRTRPVTRRTRTMWPRVFTSPAISPPPIGAIAVEPQVGDEGATMPIPSRRLALVVLLSACAARAPLPEPPTGVTAVAVAPV